MIQFAIHIVVTAALLSVVGSLVSDIEVEGGTSAVVGALVLGLANAFLHLHLHTGFDKAFGQ